MTTNSGQGHDTWDAKPRDDGFPTTKQLRLPSLQGRHVYLRTVGPADYPTLRMLETSSDIAPRWRFRGATPGPEQWAQSIWNGMLAQFLVVGRQSDTPLGIVGIYNANLQNGWGYLAAARFDLSKPSPLMMLGIGLFLEYAFACWTFRKLYMEVPEYNLAQFGRGLERLIVVEGRLRDHSIVGGELWDEVLLAIYRDAWLERGRRLVAAERYPVVPKRIRLRMPNPQADRSRA
jgi:hypothetical protein